MKILTGKLDIVLVNASVVDLSIVLTPSMKQKIKLLRAVSGETTA